MSFRPLALAALLSLSPMLSGPALAADGHWTSQAKGVAAELDNAEAAFAKGDLDKAKRSINDAYFLRFEDGKFEAAIRKYQGAKRAVEIEKMFATLRKAVTAKDADQVKQVAKTLREAALSEAKALDDAKVSPNVFEVNQ